MFQFNLNLNSIYNWDDLKSIPEKIQPCIAPRLQTVVDHCCFHSSGIGKKLGNVNFESPRSLLLASHKLVSDASDSICLLSWTRDIDYFESTVHMRGSRGTKQKKSKENMNIEFKCYKQGDLYPMMSNVERRKMRMTSPDGCPIVALGGSLYKR